MPEVFTSVAWACDAALLGQPELLIEIQEYLLPLVVLGPGEALRRGGSRLLSLWVDAAALLGVDVGEYSAAAIFEAVAKTGLGFLERALTVNLSPKIWTSVAYIAMRHKNREILRFLAEKIPAIEAPEALDIAASVGDVELFEWLQDSAFGGCFVTQDTLARAVRENRVDLVEWMLEIPNLEEKERMICRAMNRAAQYGYFTLLQRLREVSDVWFSPHAVTTALIKGHYDMADWLFEQHQIRVEDGYEFVAYDPSPPWLNVNDALIEAFSRGDIRMLDWLRVRDLLDVKAKYTLRAKIGGHVQVLDYLETHYPDCGVLAFNAQSAAGGSIAVASWAHARGLLVESMAVLQTAGKHGHIEFMKWYEKTVGHDIQNVYDPQSVEIAASKGFAEATKFLVEHDYADVSRTAIHRAAVNGHLTIAQWLLEHSQEDVAAMLNNEAARLAADEPIPFYTVSFGDTMNEAAAEGHLDVAKWLHAMGFVFHSSTIRSAALNGHLEVVQYLVKHALENDIPGALEASARRGHLRVVKFLLSHFPLEQAKCELIADMAKMAGHLRVAKWIRSHGFAAAA